MVFPDWKAGGHGVTNVRKALAESVSIFSIISAAVIRFCRFGRRSLGKIYEAVRLLGETGIDLNGESAGFVPTSAWKEETKNEAWYMAILIILPSAKAIFW